MNKISKFTEMKNFIVEIIFFFVQIILYSKSQFSSTSSHQQQQQSNNQVPPKIRSVNTPFGVLRGLVVNPSGKSSGGLPALRPVTQFLGIPYGSAPTGNQRFKMAISASKWTHQPKDAFKPPPSCTQSGLPTLLESKALKVTSAQRFDRLHHIMPFLKPESEDCLFINMFVPEREPRLSPQPLSVLVLVHGDSDFAWGGANAQNGTMLASLGEVLVVTLNYRLGVYGFLGRCESEAHTCAGNAGLSDLVAALKMLSNLLPSFGADPDLVTLLGWESGAALVTLLMGSPITQPKNRLFRRAILLDGSAMSPWAMAQSAQTQFMRLAEELKCFNHRSSSNSFLDESLHVLRCIQEHSEQNVSSAARHVASASPTFLSAFAPVVDGQIVPNHPRVLFNPQYGTLFREIDLMAGTVLNPAHHLLANEDLENGISVEKRDKILRTLVRNIFDFHRTEIFQAILNKYTDWENPKDHPKSVRNGLMATLGDILFTTSLIETLRAHSIGEGILDGADEKKSANTFFFVFAHDSSNDQSNTGLRGSFTGDHLPYILGTPLVEDYFMTNGEHNNQQHTAEDKQLSRVMITYMANFIKSGDPTRPQPMLPLSSLEDRFQGIPWPQFSASTREAYMEITKDRPRMKNYYRNSFVQFWIGFIPILNRMGEKDILEEHHLLPAHFDRATFFGVPRPFAAILNIPFPPPPPPPPPTPFPKELRDKLLLAATASSATKRPASESGEYPIFPSKMPESAIMTKSAEFNPNWGWMVVIGVTLTVANLCILIVISRKCVRRHSDSKKKFQYQSYTTGGIPPPLPAMDMNFALMAQQQEHERRRSLHPQQCFQHQHQHHFKPSPQKALLANSSTANDNKISTNSNNNNDGDITATTNNKIRLNNKQLAVDFVEEATLGRSPAGLFDAVRANEAAIARRRQSVLWLRMRRGGDSLSSSSGDVSLPSTFTLMSPPLITATAPMMTTTSLGQTPMALNSNRIPLGQQKIMKPTPDMDTVRRVSTGSSGSIVLPRICENTYTKRSSLQVHQEPLLSSASSKNSTPAPTLVQIQPSSANSGLIRLGPTGISPTCPRHGRAAQLLMAKASAVNDQNAEVATGQQQQQLDEIRV